LPSVAPWLGIGKRGNLAPSRLNGGAYHPSMDESKLTFGAYWRIGVIVSIGWMTWAAVERSSIMALLVLPLLAVLWFCAVGVIDGRVRKERDRNLRGR
jgi:hypothetical protein